MNPLENCFKGYKKCVKKCFQPETCRICPYINECCRKYCIFPRASSKAINEETGELADGVFEECIGFVLKGEGVLSSPACELMSSMGLLRKKGEDG